MRENIADGYMVEAGSVQNSDMVYYIPHHAVSTSKKFRIVYDGSCKTSLGLSLNDAQFAGPRLQCNLNEILMRFRQHKIAFTADIKSMFLRARLNPKHWDLQRIFWRENSNAPLKEYWLVVVVFGLKSSPYLAVRSMLQIEPELEQQFEEAVKAIRNNFYMDDCATGADDEKSAIKLANGIKTVLSKSDFELCKWSSNSERLVQAMDGNESVSVLFDEKDEISVLGLRWQIKKDEFSYEVREREMAGKLTKRIVLGKIARLYDPMGFIAPVITSAKILMRKLWLSNLSWDDPIPYELEQEWNAVWSTIMSVEQIHIPRWLGTGKEIGLQLHGFADSSIAAYGCGIYLRVQNLSGQVSCHLIGSKSRIAPVKEVTIPKLELAAAELLTKFFVIVRNAMELQNVQYFLWSDSTTVLQWIRRPLHELKVFVANRVRTIHELSAIENWRHVRTADNPADLVSRGLTAKEIVNNSLWWHGPEWLSKPQGHWPEPLDVLKVQSSIEMQGELKVHSVSLVKTDELSIHVKGMKKEVFLLYHSNDLSKLVRVMGYVLRFVANCRVKEQNNPFRMATRSNKRQVSNSVAPELLSEEEKKKALQYLIRRVQMKAFHKEYNYLKERSDNEQVTTVKKDSHIVKLCPFLDKDGILRVGSCISQAELPYDAKFPAIIPSKSRLSYLIAWEAHQATAHGSVQIMIQYIRARYWIPSLRNELLTYLDKCLTCIRHSAKMETQLMSDLPADRVRENKPFLITGSVRSILIFRQCDILLEKAKLCRRN
ncbi:uncharacterized protein LOC129572241 [Sitodiplosis mosellana]|uniref:uncharacterized protein LOC129572241 n=1 Tax=Sitodiplosis mosellana TaxID=263140 RepID=UPI002443B3E2|nr:uncharacterized protein LOC129572241 [Sitodiplosis mosellana]